MKKSNCMNCSERYVGCHSVCEKYLLYVEEHEAEKIMVREAKDVMNNLRSFSMEGRRKALRSQGIRA